MSSPEPSLPLSSGTVPLDKGNEGSGDEIEQSPENSSEIDTILHDLA